MVMLDTTVVNVALTSIQHDLGVTLADLELIVHALLLVGGVLVDGLIWRWILYVNIPFGVIALTAGALIIRESKDTSAGQRLDVLGLLTGGAALFALVFALVEGNRYGWGSTTIVASFAIAALAFGAFIVAELRQRTPLLNLALFRNGTFTGANLAALAIMLAMLGLLFYVALYP